MRRLALLAAFAVLVLIPGVSAEEITYNIVSYPVDQAGWNITGSIVTDGHIGDLLSSDILSWSFSISNGTLTYSEKNDQLGGASVYPTVTATSTQLLLPPAPSSGFGPGIKLFSGNNYPLDGFLFMIWANNRSPRYYCEVLLNPTVASVAWDTSAPNMGGTNPWVIAQAAPEPCSYALLGVASISLLACAWRRWRRRVASFLEPA